MNPVVLVTGASRGIGRGIAIELAKAGFSVAINYNGNRDAALEAQKLCQEACSSKGTRFEIFQASVASTADRARLVQEVVKTFGRLDALVNNAGIAPKVRADIVEASEESFEELIKTNLQGPYFLTQQVAKHWLSKAHESAIPTGFKVVYITSISADTASIMRGDYCISKAGLGMAAQLWATRLADQGIQVYEVRPGIMATDMTAGVKEKYDKMIAEGLIPQMRWGTPEDVGKMCRSLIAGDFAYSTGTVMYTDGGFHINRL